MAGSIQNISRRPIGESRKAHFHSVAASAHRPVTHPFVRPESTHPSAPTRTCNTPSARSSAQGRKPQRGDRAAGTRVRKPRGWARGPPCAMRARRQSRCCRGGRPLMPAKFISSFFRVTCSVTLCQTPRNCGCYAKFQILPFARVNSKNLRITRQKRMSVRMECTYRKTEG